MNAYERREAKRKETRKQYALKRSVMMQLKKQDAEKYYEEAFIALNGRRPMVIPRMIADRLIEAANIMYARLHEIQLGGSNET